MKLSRKRMPALHHGGGSVMFWGCFDAAGSLRSVNSEEHQGILELNVLPSIWKLSRSHMSQVLHRDNDPNTQFKAAKDEQERNDGLFCSVLLWVLNIGAEVGQNSSYRCSSLFDSSDHATKNLVKSPVAWVCDIVICLYKLKCWSIFSISNDLRERKKFILLFLRRGSNKFEHACIAFHCKIRHPILAHRFITNTPEKWLVLDYFLTRFHIWHIIFVISGTSTLCCWLYKKNKLKKTFTSCTLRKQTTNHKIRCCCSKVK